MSRDPGRLTFAEFLAYEATKETLHELVDGAPLERAAFSLRHAAIVTNVLALLRANLPTSVLVVGVDAPIRTPRGLRRADAVVTDGVELANPHVRSPRLIVEVMDESSAALDLTEKVVEYANLESLVEYVLIDSRTPWVQVVRRHGAEWERTIPQLGGIVRFESLEREFELRAIYASVTFNP